MNYNMQSDAPGAGFDRLNEAALAAVAGLARLNDADRQAALQALGIAQTRRPWTPRNLGELPT